MDIRAEGLMQTLDISNYEEATSLYKPKQSKLQGTLSRQETIGSAHESFEAVTEEEIPSLNLRLNLAGLGVSLINHGMVEVVYMSLSGLSVEYTRTVTAQALTLSCSTIQVDNQLHDAIYPVALQPSPLPKDQTMTTPPPAVQASVIFLNDQGWILVLLSLCVTLIHNQDMECFSSSMLRSFCSR